MEDELLKLRLRFGSREALRRIYEKHLDSLLSLAMALLNDASVILGWSSVDRKSNTPPDAVFRNLQFGGPTPAMPVEIYGLRAAGPLGESLYTGRHIAFTRKGDRFIEWSLFIPNAAPLWSVREFGYDILYRFNLPRVPEWTILLKVYDGLHIETAEDFDTWVLGVMAELSDGGAAPEQVTYERVTELARQIRTPSLR